jgi:REP element-mobilizing transposase RayT
MRHPSQEKLLFPNTWGGRREGAGRPRSSPWIPHERRDAFAARHPVHVTLKVRPDVPSLRHAKLVGEVERSFRKACERQRFRVVHYSLQSNHVHLIVEAAGAKDLGRGMKSIGARLARAVNRVFSRKGPVLADRFHHRVLKTPREVRHALAYVLLNARRHAGRRARKAGKVDPASSGRWFDGWRRKAWASHDPPAVAEPHTWLIRKGWRRHGLIGLDEIPARA